MDVSGWVLPAAAAAVVVVVAVAAALPLRRRGRLQRSVPVPWERAFAHAPVGLAVVDGDGRILQVNRSLAALVGWGVEQLPEKPFTSLLDPAGERTFARALATAAGAPGEVWSGELALRRDGGDLTWVLVGLRCIPPPAPSEVVVQVTDLSAQRARQQELRHRAMHDRLTGLPGRELFVERLCAALDRRAATDSLVAVLFCDLDGFKEVNDGHGHAYGDQLLAITARRLAGALRASELVARWGGDEFIVLCEDLENLDEAAVIAARLIAACSNTLSNDDIATSISMSVGIAVPAPGERDPYRLIDAADTAMYLAKRAGRGRWALADSHEPLRSSQTVAPRSGNGQATVG